MSSPCLSGGGRAYSFDLEIVKSPASTSTRTSQTSSPSSTLSESSNTQLAISTRKSRTPRKRPNQTYNEATVLLSTAYPNVFSAKHLPNPRKFTKPHDSHFCESSDLILPFRVIDSSAFLLHQPLLQQKPNSQIQSKLGNLWERPCSSPGEIDFQPSSMEIDDDCHDDFDAESILDEEIEEGIDSIMGNLSAEKSESGNLAQDSCFHGQMNPRNWNCYWNPLGLGLGRKFERGFEMRRGTGGAMKQANSRSSWCFPTVDVVEISPKLNKPSAAPVAATTTKKKKKKMEKLTVIESKNAVSAPKEKPNLNSNPNANTKSSPGLLLKLNYEAVENAWSDRGSPFSDAIPASDTAAGNDVNARLAQIDLFWEGGGLREASVLRYKEKRRTRLFSKKIRYQVRKVNADGRPRMKGRFVRRSNNSSTNGHNR